MTKMDPHFARRKSIIIHAYRTALDRAARLASAARMPVTFYDSEIDSRIEQLLVDDLIHFCISARRLVEASMFRGEILQKNIHLKKIRKEDFSFERNGKTLPFMKIVNKVIHSHDVNVFDNRFKVAIYSTGEIDVAIKFMGQQIADALECALAILGEDNKYALFSLQDFVVLIDEFLSQICNHCNKQAIYLELLNDEI